MDGTATPAHDLRRPARRIAAAAVAALVAVPIAAVAPAAAAPDGDGPVVPVDPQQWTDQAQMTWDDYVNVRPGEWASAETSEGSESQYRTAVILLDFTDQPFLVTQEPGSHPFGNPQEGFEPVPRDQVDEWYLDYFTVPSEKNGFQTLHSYWMEDSHGTIGVDVEVFGGYTLPGKLHEYGINNQMNGPIEQFCPMGDTCGKDLRTDGTALWRDDIGCAEGLCGFDNIFIVTAGHDESSTWEEFGQMRFANRDEIPDELGPPRNPDGTPVLNQLGEPMTNWAATRYVEWTSWRAAANHWPNAGGGISTQAESSGQSVYAHEFSHLRGLPDNYNNPFADNTRNYTGYWEMMSRGTFNGPGGTHHRWEVPNVGGSGLGPHHMVHYKQQLGVLDDEQTVNLTRSGLRDDGVAVATLRAREYVPGERDQVALDLDVDGGWTLGACEAQMASIGEPDTDFWCPDGTSWLDYTMEVVDRVGNDSFTPGHGVLLAQNRNSGSPREWLIDANPQNIDRVDYVRPDGTEVPVVRGDPRQLDDATFQAGTGSGSGYEWVDEANGLHLYVLDAYRDRDGVLTYDVAARSLEGSGDQDRGARLGRASDVPVGDSTALVTAQLTNTGEAGPGVHGSDVYRLSATVSGDGWEVDLPYEVTAVGAGSRLPVSAYVTADRRADRKTTVTITATSESDPDVVTTTRLKLDARDLRVSFHDAERLVRLYADQDVLTRSEARYLLTQLRLARVLPSWPADRALERFAEFAEGLASEGARNLASAALVSVADELGR